MKAKLGHLTKAVNKNKKSAANKNYKFVYMVDGKKTNVYAFTDSELKRPMDRAGKNKEDLPELYTESAPEPKVVEKIGKKEVIPEGYSIKGDSYFVNLWNAICGN